MVLPIGPLMIEHRLIERMIAQMNRKLNEFKTTKKADPTFIDIAVDFIKNYADKCHHGKEEDILFRELEKKELKPEHQRIMKELVEEHKWGRKTTCALVIAKQKYLDGDETALDDIIKLLEELVTFYPKHIEKEDKHFFKPAMGYFTRKELDEMLQEEYTFDREFIHKLYENIITDLEKE